MSSSKLSSFLIDDRYDKYLPSPTIGKIGSIIFFVTLFLLCNPNIDGYNEFRKCHGNCMNGILHSIGMPLAVSGVMCIVHGLRGCNPNFTRNVQSIVVTLYLSLYITYESCQYYITPILFYILYMSIFEFILYRKLYSKKSGRLYFILLGIILVFVNVSTLEVIGHGYYEHHHSYVSEFFNSVFHTPLYGINSVVVELLKQYKTSSYHQQQESLLSDASSNSVINTMIDDFLSTHECWY